MERRSRPRRSSTWPARRTRVEPGEALSLSRRSPTSRWWTHPEVAWEKAWRAHLRIWARHELSMYRAIRQRWPAISCRCSPPDIAWSRSISWTCFRRPTIWKASSTWPGKAGNNLRGQPPWRVEGLSAEACPELVEGAWPGCRDAEGISRARPDSTAKSRRPSHFPPQGIAPAHALGGACSRPGHRRRRVPVAAGAVVASGWRRFRSLCRLFRKASIRPRLDALPWERSSWREHSISRFAAARFASILAFSPTPTGRNFKSPRTLRVTAAGRAEASMK